MDAVRRMRTAERWDRTGKNDGLLELFERESPLIQITE